MRLKDKLRISVFKLIGARNVDKLRYLKFLYKFSKFSKTRDKNIFIKKFSEFYEPEMEIIPKILSNPHVIIDIGANYGPYSFFLSKLYPQSKIFAFEPVTSSYNILNRIIRKFNLKNVISIKKGLGVKEETKEIVMPLQYTILAYVSDKDMSRKKEDQTEEIEITTLDNFVRRNKIKTIDFIKCDVEGFELNVFKGSKNTLKKQKPIVLVEIEERHTKKYGIKPNEIIDFFRKLRYNCYGLRNNKLFKINEVNKDIPLYLFIYKNHNINSILINQ